MCHIKPVHFSSEAFHFVSVSSLVFSVFTLQPTTMLPRTIPIFLLALWTIPTMVSNASIENIDHALSQFKISKGAKLSDYLNRTYDWQEIDLRQCYDATFGRGTLIDIFKESLSQVIYKFFVSALFGLITGSPHLYSHLFKGHNARQVEI